jgi:hypothetical protein
VNEVALETAQIRARKRPRAVLVACMWELACGLFIATPVHAWARSTWGGHPDGDAVFFRPGGHALLSWLGERGAALPIVVKTSFVTMLGLAVLGQIVTVLLVASLATADDEGRPLPLAASLRTGVAAFVPMLGIGVLAAVSEGFVLGLGLLAGAGLEHALQESIGDARAFTVQAVVVSLFAIAMSVVGVLADFARVAVARDAAMGEPGVKAGRRMRTGLGAALRATRRSLVRGSLAWAWRAALGFLLVYVGARAGDVAGGAGGIALWALFALHQVIVLARTALRASWLANALRLVLPT